VPVNRTGTVYAIKAKGGAVVTQQRVSADDRVESFEVRAFAVERLTFFADAVIAIAITLLALDLPVPEGTTNQAVLDFAGAHRDQYIAFLVSFLVIGARWRGHHSVFRYVTALGRGLTRLTLFWLLMQVLTPFATRVLTGDGAFQVRFVFYAATQSLASLIFIFMVRAVQRHGEIREDTPPARLSDAIWGSGVLAVAFLVSIPVCFVNEAAAYGCWIAVPLVSGVATAVRRRRAQRGSSHSPASMP
jgi:uncharacterized membrane protein